MVRAVRRLLLIRHGQYDEESAPHMGGGRLTALGRLQAQHTAKSLHHLQVDTIHSSTLIRARETAAFFSDVFPDARVVASKLLCECIPTKIPAAFGIDPAQIKRDRKQADAAFRKLFRAAKSSRIELVVCHGNIIRYFVCRALGVAPEAWVRMHSLHCGISEVSIYESGEIRVASYNETAHLPPKLRTMSGAAAKRD